MIPLQYVYYFKYQFALSKHDQLEYQHIQIQQIKLII